MSLAVATRLGGGALTGVHLDDDGFLLEHRLWNRTLAPVTGIEARAPTP